MPSRKKFDRAKSRFKSVWGKVLNGLSRSIVVYLQDSESECPNCYYDKVNKASSGVYKAGGSMYFVAGRCPVCLGKGVLTTARRRCIEGIVIWNPGGDNMNSLTFTEAGFEGATKVEIKTDPCHLQLIKECKYVVIDGIRCRLSNPPILRGIGEQHILIALFFTSDKPKIGSGERIN